MRSLKFYFLLLVLFLAGWYLRFYHIEFGLPHSFHADEPEFTELAIKYTYELKDVIANNNWYKLIPVSYVYGTLPSYMLTVAVMVFSKIHNVMHWSFEKTDLFIFMRQFTAMFSLLLLPVFYFLYKKLFGRNLIGLGTLIFLLAFNWKLIVHAHYVNADIVLTVLLGLVFLLTVAYFENTSRANLLVLGLVFGLAVGTKITALISLPLLLYILFVKKDAYGAVAFLFLTLLGFILTNPFSIIFMDDFVFRIYSMLFKEGGLVFDSVDTNPFKYLLALVSMTSPIVGIVFVAGIVHAVAKKAVAIVNKLSLHIFLLGNVAVYLIFFSVQSRLVDRWLLPVLPIIFVYFAYFFSELVKIFSLKKVVFMTTLAIAYLYYPTVLLTQFQRYTPKSEAYLWAQKNILPISTKLVITEEGLDPMNKLPFSTVEQFNVYEADGAQFNFPPDPLLYDYVILASKPMTNFKRPEVVKKFPYYAQKWQEFENAVLDERKFDLVQSFALPKTFIGISNLVNLSDVFVYKKKSPF